MRELRERVAVITGAASGIGYALAERFASEGMRLVLADVEVPALDHAAATLEAEGAAVLAVPTDVSDAGRVEALAAATYERFGACHVLCNNAGVTRHRRAWEYDLADWQWILGVNLFGVIHGVHAFVPRMLAGGEEGHVVNTASSQALRHGMGAYGTSKHAVAALSEALLRDLVAVGAAIGVTVICPGPIATNIAEAARNRPPAVSAATTPLEDQLNAWARTMTAGGRPPAELAALVVAWIRANQFWGIPAWIEDDTIRARSESMVRRANPSF